MNELVELECACATIRRAARLVTQLYDTEFAGLLEGSQFALLTMIDKKPGCNQSAVVRVLGLDKTTVSRNLRVLERNGWIEAAASDDRRERGWKLSRRGKDVLTKARPRWKRAQERLRSAMTASEWEAMFGSMRVASNAARRVSGERI